MKYAIIIFFAAILRGVFANPLVRNDPETRISNSASTNLTVYTFSYVTTCQTKSSNALLDLSLSSNFWLSPYYLTYTWFLQNYCEVGNQQIIIQSTGLLILFGSPDGRQCVSASITKIINVMTQACQYLAIMDPAGAAEFTIRIQAVILLQEQISVIMNSCANSSWAMCYTCPDSLYTLICQCMYQAATILMQITTSWCSCAKNGGTATTTSTSTTTSKVRY